MTAHPIDTEALRKLADAATEGPWYTFETKLGRRNGIGSKAIPEDEAVMEDEWSGEADAEFIAAAREAIPALLDALEQAEAERDWNLRSSRLAKKERIKANARAEKAEARVRHLEDTARVLVKDMLAATDARDEHRRGKAAAEERIAEEKHLRMKATEAATKAEARIEAVEDVLDTWMTYCQTEQTARALSDEEELNLITAINMIREAIGYE